MTRTSMKMSATVSALSACIAFASTAEAGGYPTNGCVAKKQGALTKFAGSVEKAWDKYPSDAMARGAAIDDAAAKLDSAWQKAEATAVKKNSSCDEATSTFDVAADAITAVLDAATAGDRAATADYLKDALKSYGKYIKAPTKDPGKANLTTALGEAVTDNLADASMQGAADAVALKDELIRLTTTAPDYPAAFQTITPGNTVVYGKETLSPKCVDGDPYIYFARKGTSNNVLMYYQGGGACWSKDSCFTIGTCDRISDAGDSPDLVGTGFGDYNNPANPFYDWSVVFVSYCTCDVHWGENNETYAPGQTANHRGRVNAAVAEKFAREHFVDPDRVFSTGSSAGSYGAIMNSYYLMKDVWPNADHSVLGDAGIGVITQNWLDDYIANWGVAENFPEDVPGVALPVENLSIVDLVAGLAERFPNARFANYDSSYDGGGGSQCNFFQVMRWPSPPIENIAAKWGNWWESACEWNACMREFKEEIGTRQSNYKGFTGAGTRHTIFGSDKVYTETKSTTAGGTGVTFVDWVTAMIDNTPAWVDVSCNNPGGDCNLTNSCQGGSNAGGFCTVNGDCPGGSCQHDPDVANAPFNNDDTVNCAPTVCPCTAQCAGGTNDGTTCTSDADCTGGGRCPNVGCPTFTP